MRRPSGVEQGGIRRGQHVGVDQVGRRGAQSLGRPLALRTPALSTVVSV